MGGGGKEGAARVPRGEGTGEGDGEVAEGGQGHGAADVGGVVGFKEGIRLRKMGGGQPGRGVGPGQVAEGAPDMLLCERVCHHGCYHDAESVWGSG